MIPASYVQDWSTKAPWADARQIEQDLIISRALCDLMNAPMLKDKIAFRGGTAINKLLFKQPLCHGSASAIVSRPDILCTWYLSSRPKLIRRQN